MIYRVKGMAYTQDARILCYVQEIVDAGDEEEAIEKAIARAGYNPEEASTDRDDLPHVAPLPIDQALAHLDAPRLPGL